MAVRDKDTDQDREQLGAVAKGQEYDVEPTYDNQVLVSRPITMSMLPSFLIKLTQHITLVKEEVSVSKRWQVTSY